MSQNNIEEAIDKIKGAHDLISSLKQSTIDRFSPDAEEVLDDTMEELENRMDKLSNIKYIYCYWVGHA